MSQLEDLRLEISDIDNDIMTLLARRMKAVRAVGDYKKENMLPIKDFKVEKEILDRAKFFADSARVKGEYICDVMRIVIDHSVREQDQIRQSRKPLLGKDVKSCLIVGGGGHMGLWLAQFIESMGHQVSISDIDMSDPRCEKFSCIKAYQDKINDFDWVFLATPMEVTASLIGEFSRRKVSSVIVEICSLKKPVLENLLQAERKGLRMVSLHPMFGPDVNYLSGKNIVFCQTQNESSDFFGLKTLFQETSACLIEIPIQQHDKLMSYVLGAAHLVNLVFAGLMAKSSLNLEDMTSLAGTTFSRQLELSSGVSQENQNLYFDIQSLNSESERIFEDFDHVFKFLRGVIDSNKRQDFLSFMENCKSFLNS